MRYTVILQRESDGGYVAVVPSLPGCVSQGDTREEALKNIEEAAELYIEDVQAAGDPLPIEDQREFIEPNTSTRRLSFPRTSPVRNSFVSSRESVLSSNVNAAATSFCAVNLRLPVCLCPTTRSFVWGRSARFFAKPGSRLNS